MTSSSRSPTGSSQTLLPASAPSAGLDAVGNSNVNSSAFPQTTVAVSAGLKPPDILNVGSTGGTKFPITAALPGNGTAPNIFAGSQGDLQLTKPALLNKAFNGSFSFHFVNGNRSSSVNSSLFSSCASVYQNYYTSLQIAWLNTLPFSLSYSRPTECEAPLRDHCLIWLDGIDLLYWPTPYAQRLSPRTTVPPNHGGAATYVADGYTFTSGSAYVVYKNAHAVLPYNTDKSSTGPFYTSLTVRYPNQAISSFYNCNPHGIWPAKQVDFEDFNQPPRWSVVSEQRPCHLWSIHGDSLQDKTFPPADIATGYDKYTNSPLVLLPGPLTDVDPTWQNCLMGDVSIGLYDPPRPLKPADAMAPEQTIAASAVAQETPQPASGLGAAGPTRTPITVTLPNGQTIVDFPPAGASINSPAQSDNNPASTGIVVANRPSPGIPSQPNSPQANGGLQSSNVATPAQGNTGSGLGEQQGQNSTPQSVVVAGPQSQFGAGSPPQPVPVPGSQQAPDSPNPPSPVVNVGGHQIQAGPNGGIVVNGATLSPSQPSAHVGSVQIAVQSDGIVVGGNTIAPTQPGAAVNINGHDVHVNSARSGGQLVVDGNALAPGVSQAQVGGNQVSVLPNRQLSVLPTTLPYVALPASTNLQSRPTNQQLSPYPLTNGNVQVGDTTLSAGGPAVVISGTPVSLLPGNQGVVTGQQTVQPIPTPPLQPGNGPAIGLLIGGQTLTPVGNGGIAYDGTTLSTSGQALTFADGKVASLNGGQVIVAEQTFPIPAPIATTATLPPLIVDGHTFTPTGHGGLVIDGTTLSSPGQTYALPNGHVATLTNGNLVVDATTLTIPTSTSIPLSVSYLPNGRMILDNIFTLTPIGSAGVAYAGATISSVGQVLTLADGTTAALVAGGALVVNNGAQTLPIPPVRTTPAPPSSSVGVGFFVAEGFTLGPLTSLANGAVFYQGVTITPGGNAVTLPDGKIMSLRPSGTATVAGNNVSFSLQQLFSGTAAPASAVTPSLSNTAFATTTAPSIAAVDGSSGGGGRKNPAASNRPLCAWHMLMVMLARMVLVVFTFP